MMGEWWATESLVFLAAFLPDPTVKVAAVAIYQTVNSLVYMLLLGVHVAASVRVGHELGRGQAGNAKRAGRVAPVYGGVVGGVMGVSLFVLRDYYPRIFTCTYLCLCRVLQWFSGTLFTTLIPSKTIPKQAASVREILQTRSTASIATAYVFGDGIQAACTGVLKGSGKQTVAYLATLLSYFGVGIPAAVLLAFQYELDLLGLCLGLTIGCYAYVGTTALLVYCTDWDAQVAQARDRLLGRPRSPHWLRSWRSRRAPPNGKAMDNPNPLEETKHDAGPVGARRAFHFDRPGATIRLEEDDEEQELGGMEFFNDENRCCSNL